MASRSAKALTPEQVKRGMNLVIADGLASEAMTSFTGGTFLVAMVLLLGASNTQIGLIAGLPAITNISQLLSIWLVRRFHTRRGIAVASNFLGRSPLLLIGAIILFNKTITVETVILILLVDNLFGAIAGPCWNAWMKDLIPENVLGYYFAKRTSYTQALNVILVLATAFLVDYIRNNKLDAELNIYAYLFIAGGVAGLLSASFLAATPEPAVNPGARGNILTILQKPLKDHNFRRLLIFNSVWAFALNMATPFFIVFMMKEMNLSITYIIGLTVISQLFGIFTVRVWGRFADSFSNKTILAICAPLYIMCLVGWCFVGIYTKEIPNLVLLLLIHTGMGISNAGINLSLTNISLKLSPAEESVVYLSTKNIIVAVFTFLATVAGGSLADYFANRSLSVNAQWKSPHLEKTLHLVDLHEWNFLFLIAAGLAFIAVELLLTVKETGEVDKDVVIKTMRTNIKSNLREYFVIGQLVDLHEQFRKRIKKRLGRPDLAQDDPK